MLNGAVSEGVRPSLGIGAKSVHTLTKKRNDTSVVVAPMDAKKMRYELQAAAARLMYDREALKQHRVCGCSRNIASDGVVVYRAVDGSNARFSNLMTCGSVWACPVCAAKVTEARREELDAAIKAWVSQHQGSILLMTLTFPHEADMPLAELLEKFANALQKFKNSRAYKNTFGTPKHPGKYERAGSVRSLEVTSGANGWHPHTHDLVFVKRDGLLGDSRAIEEIRQEWVKQLLKAGLGDNSKLNDMLEHGLDLRGGDYAAEYVAKYGHEPKLYESWSAAREVTKAHSKVAGGMQATPFMLLSWANGGDPYSAAKFREFVQCFDGKRMNYWSPGLRQLLAIEEIDDEELAQEGADPAPEEEHVIRLDGDQWKLILERNARAEVLQWAAAFGEKGVLQLLDELQERRAEYNGYHLNHQRPDVSRFYH
jgi:hypothetical protein